MLLDKISQVNNLADKIKQSRYMVVDIESNGLSIADNDNFAVGIAIYLPDYDESYYIPIFHGVGSFIDTSSISIDDKINITTLIENGTLFDTIVNQVNSKELSSSNKLVKTVLFDKFYHSYYKPIERYPNLDVEKVVSILSPVWDIPIHVYHNMSFDVIGLMNIGLPKPSKALDTMASAYSIHTAWGETYFNIDGKNVKGNLQLKWQAENLHHWSKLIFDNHPDIKVYYDTLDVKRGGEDKLKDAVNNFTTNITSDYHQFLADSPITVSRGKPKWKPLPLDSKAHMWALHPSDVAYYAELDTRLTWLLHLVYSTACEYWQKDNVSSVDTYYYLSDLILTVLIPMEQNGFRIDQNKLQSMVSNLQDEIIALDNEAHNIANLLIGVEDFNVNSNTQFQDLIELVTGKELPNMQAKTLESYADELESKIETLSKSNRKKLKDILRLIHIRMELKDYTKSLETYFAKWYGKPKIHPHFKVTGTSTGRLSSGGLYGNMQNITGKAQKYSVKSVLLPSKPDYVLVEGDYSQLETIVGAWIAEHVVPNAPSNTLTQLILRGVKMHDYTLEQTNMASVMLGQPLSVKAVEQYLINKGVNPDDVELGDYKDLAQWFNKKVAYKIAKIYNFAVMYGAGYNKLADITGLSKRVAQELYNQWHNTYPSIRHATEYYNNLAYYPHNMGYKDMKSAHFWYPTDLLGLPPFVRKYDRWKLATKLPNGGVFDARRANAWKAFNSVTQGTAAQITLYSAYKVAQAYKDNAYVEMNATIHDSIIWSVHPDILDEFIECARSIVTDYDLSPLSLKFEFETSSSSWDKKIEYKG